MANIVSDAVGIPCLQAGEDVKSRSGNERLRMGCAMFDCARELMKASIGPVSEQELRKQIFLRTYGGDFDAETTVRIVAYLLKPR